MAALTHTLTLEVATPLGMALKTEAESVQAPSVLGEFGVLPEHVPLLASLKAGVLKYKVEGKDFVAAIGPGFVEADATRVQILTEAFVKPETIDIESVRKEFATADETLKKATDPVAQREAGRAVAWAQTKLEAATTAATPATH